VQQKHIDGVQADEYGL